MPQHLRLVDGESRNDALTFAHRAGRLSDPAVRLQGSGGVLVMTVAPVAPRGLLDTAPTVLAMRILHADPELECDLTVDATALGAASDAREIVLPEAAVRAAWAGVSPPRSGWERDGSVDAAALAAYARDGMSRVADALPENAGDDVVQRVRGQIWSEAVADWRGLPLGTAFAAVSMGFISGAEDAGVYRAGTWSRVSLVRGHVLVRGPAPAGLTTVRRTGSG